MAGEWDFRDFSCLPLAEENRLRFELGPLGQGRPAMAKTVSRGVMFLNEQEGFELVGAHVRDRSSVSWPAEALASASAGLCAAP